MIKKCKNIFSKIINAKLKPNDQTQDIANTSLQVPHAQNSTNAKKTHAQNSTNAKKKQDA